MYRSWNSHTHVCAPCCISTRLACNTVIYLHIEIERHVHWELQLCFRQIQHNVYDHTRISMYSLPHLASPQLHHKAILLSSSTILMPMCWEFEKTPLLSLILSSHYTRASAGTRRGENWIFTCSESLETHNPEPSMAQIASKLIWVLKTTV